MRLPFLLATTGLDVLMVLFLWTCVTRVSSTPIVSQDEKNPCIPLPCPPPPGPPICNKTVPTYYNVSGHICPACWKCVGDDVSEAAEPKMTTPMWGPGLLSPTPMGTPPCLYLPCGSTDRCEKTKHTYYVKQDKLCVGCDTCDDRDADVE